MVWNFKHDIFDLTMHNGMARPKMRRHRRHQFDPSHIRISSPPAIVVQWFQRACPISALWKFRRRGWVDVEVYAHISYGQSVFSKIHAPTIFCENLHIEMNSGLLHSLSGGLLRFPWYNSGLRCFLWMVESKTASVTDAVPLQLSIQARDCWSNLVGPMRSFTLQHKSHDILWWCIPGSSRYLPNFCQTW